MVWKSYQQFIWQNENHSEKQKEKFENDCSAQFLDKEGCYLKTKK